MRDKEQIIKLKSKLSQLESDFYTFQWKIENPPEFKKGDKVRWSRTDYTFTWGVLGERSNVQLQDPPQPPIERGIVSHIDFMGDYNPLNYCDSMTWRYTIIQDCQDIRTANENQLSYDTPGE